MRWYQRLFRRTRTEKQLDAELRFHLEQQIADYVAAGMTPEEARRRARLEFGGLDQVKEDCRDVGAARFIETLIQDVRYGLRQLRRNPGFTTVAVITLASGIGANTAMFSVVYAALLRPLPFRDPGRIVELEGLFARRMHVVSKPKPHIDLEVESWVKDTRTLEDVSYYQTGWINLAGEGEAQRVAAAAVSEHFFRLLGVAPIKGRTFLPEEENGNYPPAAIISYSLWRNRYGSDPRILGKSILVNGRPCTVIGIMPEAFSFPAGTEVWLPVIREANVEFGGIGNILPPLARLRPGMTREQARAELAVLHQINEFGPRAKRPPIEVVPLHRALVGDSRPALIVLSGAVLLVLLIACANVASLMLARGARRVREMSVRAAVGASRGRLIRQMLTESGLIGCVGGGMALLLGWWMMGLARIIVPANGMFVGNIAMNGSVLAFCFALSLCCGILCGLLPALQSTHSDLHEQLKEAGIRNDAGRRPVVRSQSLLVMAETGIALVLLIGAGLLIKSFAGLLDVNHGCRTDHVVTARVDLLGPKYVPQELRSFYEAVLSRVSAVPGVKGAAFTNQLPLITYGAFPIKLEDQSARSARAVYYTVSPDYFRVMGIVLLAGRTFTKSECAHGEHLALISRAMARRYWPGESPLGKRFRLAWWPPSPPFTVIGVVGQVRGEFSITPQPQMYVPIGTEPVDSAWLVVHTAANPVAVAGAIREAVSHVDDQVPLSSVSTMRQMISRSLASPRFRTLLLGTFAAMAFLLAVVGIYGVVSYSVSRRSHEIGIRMALGAQKADVLRLIMAQGMLPVVLGLGGGVCVGLGLTRFLSSLLFGVKPTDPLTFVAVSVLLAAVASLACYIPARRAAKVDPTVALRYE